MLVLAVMVLGLLTVPLLRGRLTGLADVRLRRTWLLPTALGLQVLVLTVVPTADERVLSTVHIGTYVLAGLWIWWNRAVPGLPVLGLGAACNGVTIALNGGTLPASAQALERSGWVHDEGEFTNSGVLEDPVLPLLGDVFWVPAGWPLANVFSVGDILIVAGTTYMAHAYGGTVTRWRERRRTAAGGVDQPAATAAADHPTPAVDVPAPRAADDVAPAGTA